MSDKPPGAYDTGGSGFDATRAADTSAAAPQEAAERPPSAGGINVPPVAEPAPAPPGAVPQAAWDRAVGAWIDAHVRSSSIAQSGDAWAHLNAVLPRLRALLEQELKT